MPTTAREERAALVLGPFVKLDNGGSPCRFRKEVLRVWSGVDPKTGQKLSFDRLFLERLAKNTNRWIELGHKVPAPDGHTDSAMSNLGWWPEYQVDGDTLFGIFEAADEGVASKIGTSIRDVSIFASGPEQASNGEVLDAVILHCCLTPEPVLPGQANFVRLARETTMDPKTTNLKLAGAAGADPAPEASSMTPAEALKFLAVLFGLAPDADPAATVEAARACLIDEDEEDDVAGVAPVTSYMARLERRIKKAQESTKAEFTREIEALKAKESKRRTSHAKDLLELARKRSAESGILLGDDEQKRIASFLESDDERLEGAGRDMINMHLARTEDAKKALALGGTRVVKPEQVKKEEEAVLESDKAVAELLLTRGVKYEAPRAGK